jgi:hypothetical protein
MSRCHFSSLKQIHQSPAHYRAALATPWEGSPSTRIGSIVHHMVLGPSTQTPVILFDGADRRAKGWKEFHASHKDSHTIVTRSEWDEAEPIANAVKSSELARQYLDGARYETPLTWEYGGLQRATRGVDIIGAGWIADLKTARCAEPRKFMREACNMFYHAQAADYREACRANGIACDEVYILAVETSAPYPVVVFKMVPEVLELGLRLIDKWSEKLRQCQDADQWPGYAQSAVDFEAPAWMTAGEDEDEDE